MRIGLGNMEQIQIDAYYNLVRVAEKAELGVGCEEPDYKAAYKAYSEAAKCVGAYASQKTDININLDHMSTEAIIAEVKELTEELEQNEPKQLKSAG
jgi:hypothetical protein